MKTQNTETQDDPRPLDDQHGAGNQGGSDVERCTRWLEDHGNALFVHGFARVHDRAAAEDLVQETFLAAFQAIDRFEERSSELTWLKGILRYKIADYFREKGRKESRSLADYPSDGASESLFNVRGFWQTKPEQWPDDPASALENQEFWKVFDECRAKLPPGIAIAFVLRELDQLATDEICETLDISRTNFSVRMHRARTALRACLEQNWFLQD